MKQPTRETTCGHSPHHGKGLCEKCYRAKRYAREREQAKVAAQEWFAANPEKAAATRRAYYVSHRERIAAQNRAWKAANQERFRTYQKAYRAKLWDVEVDLTFDEWQEILDSFDGHCAYCDRTDRPLEMDHMVPVSRGGAHTACNVVPTCRPCNRRKSDRTVDEFLESVRPPRQRPGAKPQTFRPNETVEVLADLG